MNGIKVTFFLVLYWYSTVLSAQYITVDDTKTAQQLIEDVLVRSTCANVSNFSASGDAFTAGQNSYGYFNSNGTNFPFTEGVLLCTSTSKKAIGPYVSSRGSGSDSWLGDVDLDQSLGIKSVNATVLEFDFVPLTNFVSFNYFFASNEYQSYFPCEYSDGFAFLIKEKGNADSYKNLAVLPGTDIPVSSKNVHPLINSIVDAQSIEHFGCPAINESYFNGFNSASSPINYSGQVVKLNAQTDVIAGKTYHIKLIIADDKEEYYDSAVFLEAGSFTTKINLGPNRLSTTNNPVCFGESFTIDTKLPASYTYKWYKDGSVTPISGETASTLNVTEAGIYKVKVILSPSICEAEAEIKIEYAPQIVLNDATLIQCDDNEDGISVFDLTKMDNRIKNSDPKLVNVVYYTSLLNAQEEINPILNPSSFINSFSTQVLFARVTNVFGCPNFAQLNLMISQNTMSTQTPIESCDEDTLQDGITQFDLNAQLTPKILNGLPSGLIVEYYSNETDAITQKNPLPNNFRNTIPNQQVIYARIVNGSDCYGIIPETLIINVFDPPNFGEENKFLCKGSTIDLTVSTGFSSYLWNNGQTNNTINISTAEEYTVTVTNSKGCEKTKKIIVKPSEIGTITGANINDFAGSENSILIQYSGIGNYEFSLDNNYYQDSPLFSTLNPGIYYATVKDKNGCGTSMPSKVYLIDYPRFFTPNNDGYNDYWKIKNLDVLPKSKITIFDRYGKLLKQFNENDNWNGTVEGKLMPADDYWFTIKFEDGKIIKGHFSLKK